MEDTRKPTLRDALRASPAEAYRDFFRLQERLRDDGEASRARALAEELWEVLRQMKSDAQLKTIPVVTFTSSRHGHDLARSYQLGANAYIIKPAQFRQLTAVLEAVREL